MNKFDFLPEKQKRILKDLVKEGIFDSKEQIIICALYEFFQKQKLFELYRK